MKLLIANRGEITIRIAHAARDLGIETVSIYTIDDANSLHILKTDESVQLQGQGVRGYLDVDDVLRAAKETQVDAVHPGYGFLSENASFAQAIENAGLTFVGPTPETLALFGDKIRARQFAVEHDVNVVPGLARTVSLEDAQSFLETLGEGHPILLKAANGGGGRGMRIVRTREELDNAFERAQSEARAAFGDGSLYVESLIERARHIELQICGDGDGTVYTIGDRDCSLQRRHQKIVEIAPAPDLDSSVRDELYAAATRMAQDSKYRSLGTVEFLVRGDVWYFIEVNARLQVEHTITESVTGVDLVKLQLRLAIGERIDIFAHDLQCGFAIQARVNMETMDVSGSTKPSAGTLQIFEPPTGPNVRVDTFGYTGYQTNPNFDSLLAKVVASGESYKTACDRTIRALSDFRIEGVSTNIDFLLELLGDPRVQEVNFHTRLVDENVKSYVDKMRATNKTQPPITDSKGQRLAGVSLGTNDPLAVLELGKSESTVLSQPEIETIEDTTPVPEGTSPVRAPMQGTIIETTVETASEVVANQVVAIMEAMKMEHEIRAGTNGVVHSMNVNVGDAVYENHALFFIQEQEVEGTSAATSSEMSPDHIRDDLAEVIARHEITLDKSRPEAVATRRASNQRTARENVDDLCDPDSFVEHGQLALTPGSGLPKEEVIRKFPTDGMITGIGTVNGHVFALERARTVVMAYDYTVLAGTQGAINHPKTDRMLELCEKWRIPMVLFAEGGGGRAGTGGRRQGGSNTTNVGQGRDETVYRPLDTPTFASMGRLSGLVPMVGITSRYCFAGNASLLGCCDVIIATEGSNIGMGGPALVEGGGLGVFRPHEIGPLEVQRTNGVVDVVVKDEAEAVAVTKQYLSYFQGRTSAWECDDQRKLRHIVPENRLRVYNVRDVIQTMADTDSVLEIRPEFGLGMVTALIRTEGRPIGVIANNPTHLSGAIDSDGSDNAARFMQLCDAFDIPILMLCDTPGMMVGPEIEKTALVRHCSRLFVTGANLTVPHVTMVLRKAYGLGAQAMAGGSFKEPFATVAWPTAEFGGMGLEGQVKLGFRNELAAIEDPQERVKRYNDLVEAAYQRGRALVSGASFAVDDVIDPADSRRWVTTTFDSAGTPPPREGKKRRNIDTW